MHSDRAERQKSKEASEKEGGSSDARNSLAAGTLPAPSSDTEDAEAVPLSEVTGYSTTTPQGVNARAGEGKAL